MLFDLSSIDIQENTNSTAIMVYPKWLNSSQAQYNKFLADNYNYFVSPKGNRVWACAMNLAWNQLKRGILNSQNATFYNLNALQQKIVDNLNSEVFTKSQLSQDSYYVTSGFGQSTVEKINIEVRQKFPSRTFLQLQYELKERDFISYAYLYKNLMFKNSFKVVPSFRFNGNIVEGFEASTSKLKNQVYYKYYNNSDDFMVGLQTSSPNDEILFWKTNQTGVNDAKFQKILSMIEFYNSLPNQKIYHVDKFMMPVVELDYDRSYKEIIEAQFKNPSFEQYKIVQMKEKIKLKITRSGVSVQNQAIVIGSKSFFFGVKTFYLNSDFWVIMKQKKKKPYLVTLVRNISQTNSI